MIRGYNKHVACEPLKIEEDQDKGAKKVGQMQYRLATQRTQLVALKVVYGFNGISPGDLVYVLQAGSTQVGMVSQWTKTVDLDLGDGKTQAVVMVPLDQVQLVDYRRQAFAGEACEASS